jgi:hypothetical protein
MKTTAPDIRWLPPREEWDFRTVTPGECRVACHWEYAREIRRITASSLWPRLTGFGKDRAEVSHIAKEFCPANYRQQARELFPQAWFTLTKEQRASVVSSFFPIPAIQVRKLGEFFKRMHWVEKAKSEVVEAYLEYTYVLLPNFSLHGVEAVIKEFEAWARKEAKNYPQSPRAKGAELPFDTLKWLAVLRLDQARRGARISFEKTQEALTEYRHKFLQKDPNGVLPVYASHGAWSKAKADAERCRMKAMSESSFLLDGLS